jgi:hypothetical protein
VRTGNPKSFAGLPVALGLVAVAWGLFGLLGYLGYGTFALRRFEAAHKHDVIAAQRMALFSGCFSLAQLSLGLLAVGLSCVAATREGASSVVQALATSAFGLGMLVLVLMFLFV